MLSWYCIVWLYIYKFVTCHRITCCIFILMRFDINPKCCAGSRYHGQGQVINIGNGIWIWWGPLCGKYPYPSIRLHPSLSLAISHKIMFRNKWSGNGNELWRDEICELTLLGLSLSGTPYRQMSWCPKIEARLNFITMVSVLNLTGRAAADEPDKCQSNWKSLNPNLAASRSRDKDAHPLSE